MNLATDPWIPVLHRSGERRLASLLDVYRRGAEYADLAVRSHERIALMRLLMAVAHAALNGPKNIDEWDTVPERLPELAERYLEDQHHVFDLFHPERPFLQVAALTKHVKNGKSEDEDALTSISKLDFALATGNNTTLFDHGANSRICRRFQISDIPLMLLTFLSFSPGGLISQVEWFGRQTSKSSKHAPCTPSSMLHTFVRRPTLFETVQANLLTREDVDEHWGSSGWGKPIWEWMPENWDDSDAIRSATRSYLGRLVPLSRFLHVQPDGMFMLLGNGFDYPAFPDIAPEASATVIVTRKGDGTVLLGASEKAIWRELPALLVRRKQSEIGGALTLRNIPENQALDIWAGAFLTNKASIEDTVEAVFHVPVPLRGETGRKAYDAEVKYAEGVGNRLGWAIETWREQADGGWDGKLKGAGPRKNQLRENLRATAMRHFWTAVEKLRPLLMAHIETLGGESAEAVTASQAAWRKAVRAAAFEAYRLSCGQDTPRQIRAYALGLTRLTGGPNTQQPAMEEETMEA